MFSSYKSVTAYTQVGVETDVASADPHKLIMLLFEGAQSAIIKAKSNMEQNKIAEKGAFISRAIDIIENGLRASVDLEKGEALAEQLFALYGYMVDRLLHANIKNDPAALDEVAFLLGEIQSAWAEIRPEVVQQSESMAK